MNHGRIQYLCRASAVAALYTVLTLLSASMGLSGNGAVQLRLSEALCILPLFTSAAIPGLAVGCFLSNFLTGCVWQDILFGTIATLLGAVGTRLLRKLPLPLTTLPPILANTLIIPPVLSFCYGIGQALPLLFLSVAAGEILSAGVLGSLLGWILKKRPGGTF